MLETVQIKGTKTIVLVGCARRKRDHDCAAEEMYVSPLFGLARAWAERHGDSWFILSAHFKLLEPGRIIRPYDRSLRDMGRENRTCWANLTAHRLAERIVCPTRLVVLAGSLYRTEMLRFLKAKALHPLTIETPLAGISFEGSAFEPWGFRFRIRHSLVPEDGGSPIGWHVAVTGRVPGLTCPDGGTEVFATDTERQVLVKCRRAVQRVVLGAVCDGMSYGGKRLFLSLRGPLWPEGGQSGADNGQSGADNGQSGADGRQE